MRPSIAAHRSRGSMCMPDNAKKTVRAAFSLLSSDTAFYEEGYGCRLK